MLVVLVRADSGFFDEAILVAREAAAFSYAITARFTNLLQAGVSGFTFRPFAPGLKIVGLVFQVRRWSRARRMVMVQEELAVRPAEVVDDVGVGPLRCLVPDTLGELPVGDEVAVGPPLLALAERHVRSNIIALSPCQSLSSYPMCEVSEARRHVTA